MRRWLPRHVKRVTDEFTERYELGVQLCGGVLWLLYLGVDCGQLLHLHGSGYLPIFTLDKKSLFSCFSFFRDHGQLFLLNLIRQTCHAWYTPQRWLTLALAEVWGRHYRLLSVFCPLPRQVRRHFHICIHVLLHLRSPAICLTRNWFEDSTNRFTQTCSQRFRTILPSFKNTLDNGRTITRTLPARK